MDSAGGISDTSVTQRIANRIRVLRAERSWSARRLADECARVGGTYLTRGTIAKIESGARRYVTADELVILARAFRTSTDDLVSYRLTPLPSPVEPVYRLLGDLELGTGSQSVELPSGPTLILFATLLLNANRRISKGNLISSAWGLDLVGEAQLPKRIAAIRQLLAKVNRRNDLVTHPGYGYELRVIIEDIDSLTFQRLVRISGEVGRAGNVSEEIELLVRALRLWHGPHPLSNVPGEFRQETWILEHRRKLAAARLYRLELEAGNHERILDGLIQMAGQYPSDGRLNGQLMIAQYRCGHMTDVSETYERYRDALEQETGADPDPKLRDLHFAIARGDGGEVSTLESGIYEGL